MLLANLAIITYLHEKGSFAIEIYGLMNRNLAMGVLDNRFKTSVPNSVDIRSPSEILAYYKHTKVK
jgi:hypothetical protein